MGLGPAEGLAEDSQGLPFLGGHRDLGPLPLMGRRGGPGGLRNAAWPGRPLSWADTSEGGTAPPGKMGPQLWGPHTSLAQGEPSASSLGPPNALLHPPPPMKNVPTVRRVKIEADTSWGRRAALVFFPPILASLGAPLCSSYTW